MDFSELKKLLKSSSSVLVMDNGEPSFVVLGYRAYKELCSPRVEEREIRINPVRHFTPPLRASSMDTMGRQAGNGGAYYVNERESEIIERLNKEILALRNQIEMEERGIPNPHFGGID